MSSLLENLGDSWSDELNLVKAAIEAMLFVSPDPVSLEKCAEACEMPLDTVKEALRTLKAEYERPGHGLVIELIGGGYQIMTKPEYASMIKRLLHEDRAATGLSRAALEVLAIIAYKQPVTRAEIERLRGVSSDSAMKTLLDRGLIEEQGKKAVIGRPTLFGTTADFLRKFGLSSLDDLPVLEQKEEPAVE